jgi:hypothetical protein
MPLRGQRQPQWITSEGFTAENAPQLGQVPSQRAKGIVGIREEKRGDTRPAGAVCL